MKNFLMILIVALSSTLCLAEEWKHLEGTIRVDGLSKFIQIDNFRIPLYAGNPETQSGLRHLANGDVVSGEGRYFEQENLVVLRSIDRVGLKRLIGVWWEENFQQIYHIDNFTTMKIYQKVAPNNIQLIRKVAYHMSPSTHDDWNVILLDDEGAPVAASLKFVSGRAVLSIYNAETGRLERELVLEKLKE